MGREACGGRPGGGRNEEKGKLEKVGKGKFKANTTRKSLLSEPTLLIANDRNTFRASEHPSPVRKHISASHTYQT